MKFKALIGDKLTQAGLDFSKLGEEVLSALELEVDDTVAEEAKNLLKTNLLTRTEAENDSTLVEKHKDTWHKQARKGVLDSIDSQIKGLDSVLTESEKAEYEALDTVKKNAFLIKKNQEHIKELKSKIVNSDSDAESKAFKKELEDYKELVTRDFVTKTSISELQSENQSIKSKLQKFEENTWTEQITGLAVKSNTLDPKIDPEIMDDVVSAVVKKYLANHELGTGNVKGKIVLDSNGKVTLRQADSTEEMAIIESGKPLTVKEIVVRAIQKYNLSKKQDEHEEEEFKFDVEKDKDKSPTFKFKPSDAELERAWN